jgi:hypothetical protein
MAETINLKATATDQVLLQRRCGHSERFVCPTDDPFYEQKRASFGRHWCPVCREKRIAENEAKQLAQSQRKQARKMRWKMNAMHKQVIGAVLSRGRPTSIEGVVQLHIEAKFSAAEMNDWPVEKITQFFNGLAQTIRARNGLVGQEAAPTP